MKFGIRLLIFILLLTAWSCKKQPLIKYEVRAVWMSRFEYAQGKNAARSQAYIQQAFRKFRQAGMNLVLFQVRGNADAFYHSKYEPWSKLLTDTLGKDPGWDPLRFALQTAHGLGLELHAWINTFPAWKAEDPPPTPSKPLHPLLAHPDWVVCDSSGRPMHPKSGYISFSPGNPQVRRYIRKVVMDIVQNYDVDGIHFDYIRYPEGAEKLGYSHDSVSVRLYGDSLKNKEKYIWRVWQREQINRFLTTLYNTATQSKPWIKISAAVIGHTYSAVWNGYHSVFQDVRRWLSTAKIDLVFPMTYTAITNARASYTTAIKQWRALFHLGRPIIPGIAVYKLGQRYTFKEIQDEITLLRKRRFPGMVFFSATALLKAIDKIQKEYYPAAVLLPPFAWKKGVPPVQPNALSLHIKNERLILSWQGVPGTENFVLYKAKDTAKPENMVCIIPAVRQELIMPYSGKRQSFYLTAVNRVGRESKPFLFVWPESTAVDQ